MFLKFWYCVFWRLLDLFIDPILEATVYDLTPNYTLHIWTQRYNTSWLNKYRIIQTLSILFCNLSLFLLTSLLSGSLNIFSHAVKGASRTPTRVGPLTPLHANEIYTLEWSRCYTLLILDKLFKKWRVR